MSSSIKRCSSLLLLAASFGGISFHALLNPFSGFCGVFVGGCFVFEKLFNGVWFGDVAAFFEGRAGCLRGEES
jgi:hypothetical protein